MNGRRAVIGLALLCALASSAISAPSASAKGTTAFTCTFIPFKGGSFKDGHCTENVGSGKGDFGHVAIDTQKEPTKITISNANTANETKNPTTLVYHYIKDGKEITITCANVHATTSMSNEPGSPEKVSWAGLNVTVNGCTTSPESLGCKVAKESIPIENASAVTVAGKEEIEIKPSPGKALSIFELTGCKEETLNGKAEITGTVNAKPKGATLQIDASTSENLEIGGEPGTLTALLTKRMEADKGVPQPPIATTTVG